jgi:predicted Zn-dependent protease
MTLLSNREDALTAAEKAFGDLKVLQSDLDSYIHASIYQHFVLSSAAAPLDQSSYHVKDLTSFEADAVRADILAAVGRRNDARALLDTILKADPNNVQANETMGFLEFSEGNREAARQWYEQAVKLDSQSYLAHYYFAVMSKGSKSPEQDTAIEASLQDAIRLNSRFAPAYDQLASFYGMRHEKLEEARELSLRAIELDPGQLSFRMNAANVLMAMQRYADAQAVLRASLKVAKTPGDAEMVRSRIAQLDQIQAARAR